jgi:hypothetical protein
MTLSTLKKAAALQLINKLDISTSHLLPPNANRAARIRPPF